MMARPIASEYLVPSLKMWPTSMPRPVTSCPRGAGRGVALERVADVADLDLRRVVQHRADLAAPVEVLDVVVGLVGAVAQKPPWAGVGVDEQE
jgi:hypothetical protein